jgi:hypothetical protein
MNHLFYGVDQATHRRGLLIRLIAATLVSGIIVETGARAAGPGGLARPEPTTAKSILPFLRLTRWRDEG